MWHPDVPDRKHSVCPIDSDFVLHAENGSTLRGMQGVRALYENIRKTYSNPEAEYKQAVVNGDVLEWTLRFHGTRVSNNERATVLMKNKWRFQGARVIEVRPAATDISPGRPDSTGCAEIFSATLNLLANIYINRAGPYQIRRNITIW